jgi:hypothetical protein
LRPSVTSQGFRFCVLVFRWNDFVLVDEVADFASCILEGVTQSSALLVEKGNLLGDILILSLRGFLQIVNLRRKFLVLGRGIDGVFLLLLVLDSLV